MPVPISNIDLTHLVYDGDGRNDVVTITKIGENQYLVIANGQQIILTRDQLQNTTFNLGSGDDSLVAAPDLDVSIRVNGGTGNDIIRGGACDDILNGGGGNDRIHGRGGNDTLRGGGGDDRVSGGTGDDTLRGGAGADKLVTDVNDVDNLRVRGNDEVVYRDRVCDPLPPAPIPGLTLDECGGIFFGTGGNDVVHIARRADGDYDVFINNRYVRMTETQLKGFTFDLGAGRDTVVLASNVDVNDVCVYSGRVTGGSNVIDLPWDPSAPRPIR